IIGAWIYQHNEDQDRAQWQASFSYNVCVQNKEIKHDTNLSECQQERAKTFSLFMEVAAGNAAFLALAPIPFAWIFAYVFIGLVRGWDVGYPIVLPWNKRPTPRKIFVAVGGLISAGAAFFAVTHVLNLYTDSLTPVALSPFKDVTKFGEDLVVVEGTWTR